LVPASFLHLNDVERTTAMYYLVPQENSQIRRQFKLTFNSLEQTKARPDTDKVRMVADVCLTKKFQKDK
jgi:hypothetical protein